MGGRGVHFAITVEQADALVAADSDDALMALIDELEEAWDADNTAESDKAWDAIHRCLTDGQLGAGNGEYPLSHCILGPRQLHRGSHYLVSLVLPHEVVDVAHALELATPEWMTTRYERIVPKDYAPEYGPEDLAYTLANLDDVRALFRKAAVRKRAVVFTADP
jgi:hypothetical protein